MVSSTLMLKGEALGKLGEQPAAIAAMREGLALRRRYLAPNHWLVGSAESILGAELLAAHRRDEALASLVRGCAIVMRALGPENPKSKEALGRCTADRRRRAGEPAGLHAAPARHAR